MAGKPSESSRQKFHIGDIVSFNGESRWKVVRDQDGRGYYGILELGVLNSDVFAAGDDELELIGYDTVTEAEAAGGLFHANWLKVPWGLIRLFHPNEALLLCFLHSWRERHCADVIWEKQQGEFHCSSKVIRNAMPTFTEWMVRAGMKGLEKAGFVSTRMRYGKGKPNRHNPKGCSNNRMIRIHYSRIQNALKSVYTQTDSEEFS